MLRTKLFRYVALLILVFGILSALIGFGLIKRQVIDEAQNRVHLDLESAWSIQNARLHDIEMILRLTAGKKVIVDSAELSDWTGDYLRERLNDIRETFGLDFLGVLSPQGEVVLRAAPPHATGDILSSAHAALARALRGEVVVCHDLFSPEDLERESPELARRAHIPVERTPHARTDERKEERRGLVMLGAAPIYKDGHLLGAMYGGILLNRNQADVDNIKNTVFKNQTYEGASLGTATIFLEDTRVATTVLLASGERAVGTRGSREVADQVLETGAPWVGRAFVVRDWYLTAYDAIRNCEGAIIGMLYVGILEQPFRDLEKSLLLRYALLMLLGLGGAILLAYFLARHLADPIHRLLGAARVLKDGETPAPVACTGVCDETDELVRGFNEMARTLAERESNLKCANEQLEKAIASLRTLNQSYMNVVGFVSHELQGPVASVLNYSYALLHGTLGPLDAGQSRVVAQIQSTSERMVEMVRHYLNLSRIESGEFAPSPVPLQVRTEVAEPILEACRPALELARMRVDNRIAPDVVAHADPNMTREILENLASNAIKYGPEGGTITLEAHQQGAWIQFSVRNEGPGIPSEKQGAVFNKFSRLEPMRRQKGTGLGLFICKHIVEAHGGRIEVESHPGEWTEFRFTLPAETSG